MVLFDALMQQQEGFLATFPGDHFFGDITGHGNEWRTEFTLDYCPSDESEEQENEYSLVFALIETDSGAVLPELTLNYVVAEVGVNDRHRFTITTPDAAMAELARVCDEWDMRKGSVAIGKTLVDKIFMLKERNSGIFAPREPAPGGSD